MFPLFWWALTSIKPMSAIFNKDEVVVFDFVPTLINYAVVLLGWSRAEIAIESGSTFGVGGTSSYDSRQTIVDSIIIAVGSTALTMFIAVLAAYALSRMASRAATASSTGSSASASCRRSPSSCRWSRMYKVAGMRDTDNLFMGYVGLILIHALMNLPIAVLLLKSFFDDVPKDVDEAAMIDGATRWQTFRKIVLPMVQGRRRGGGGAVLHLLLDRVPAVAVPHHRSSARCRSRSPPSSPRRARNGASSRRSARRRSCPASSSFCSFNAIWSAASLSARSRSEAARTST